MCDCSVVVTNKDGEQGLIDIMEEVNPGRRKGCSDKFPEDPDRERRIDESITDSSARLSPNNAR